MVCVCLLCLLRCFGVASVFLYCVRFVSGLCYCLWFGLMCLCSCVVQMLCCCVVFVLDLVCVVVLFCCCVLVCLCSCCLCCSWLCSWLCLEFALF